MKLTIKILLISIFFLFVSLGDRSSYAAGAENSRNTHTQMRYKIKDELASSYRRNNLKESVRQLNIKTQTFKENAGKKFNNLLPMQGKSKAVIAQAKEQKAKLKDQQRVRNQIQRDRLSDLRQRNRELAMKRADIRQKIRFDR